MEVSLKSLLNISSSSSLRRRFVVSQFGKATEAQLITTSERSKSTILLAGVIETVQVDGDWQRQGTLVTTLKKHK